MSCRLQWTMFSCVCINVLYIHWIEVSVYACHTDVFGCMRVLTVRQGERVMQAERVWIAGMQRRTLGVIFPSERCPGIKTNPTVMFCTQNTHKHSLCYVTAKHLLYSCQILLLDSGHFMVFAPSKVNNVIFALLSAPNRKVSQNKF